MGRKQGDLQPNGKIKQTCEKSHTTVEKIVQSSIMNVYDFRISAEFKGDCLWIRHYIQRSGGFL